MSERRTAPQWVRDLDQREAHAIAFRLLHDQTHSNLTQPQEWLLEVLLADLEYRRSRARWPEHRCSCSICFAPFPD